MVSLSKQKMLKLSKEFKINIDLLNHLIDLLGPEETSNLLTLKPHHLSNTARVNLLKISRDECINELVHEGIFCKPIDTVPEGLVITKGWEKIGSSQSYLKGYVMPQGLGSMLAVHSLNPSPGEKILDMAAAPGGKSCFIAERMKGDGTLIANERSHKRISSLIHNLMRHGIQNVIVTQQDASIININDLDRIILDAPCSGDGLIVSKPRRRKSKTLANSYSMQKIQVSMLSNALSLLNSDGICIYSTCSLNTIENEGVIRPLLDQFEITTTNIPGISGNSSIHPEFLKVKRLLPSTHFCDGFFIAKLRKR